MLRTIILKNQPIEYELKVNTRSKRMRLAVYPGGRFVVSIPSRRSLSPHRGEGWGGVKSDQNVRGQDGGGAPPYVNKFLLEKADWILAKIDVMKQKTPVEKQPISKLELKRLKVVARELVHRRLEYFNDFYRFTYHNVSIRNQKTRWGSCSRQGNLNFNVKMALLPSHLADYIIVHELCHLKEMNHSPKFWKLVAQTFPEYKELRRELKKGLL